MQVVAPAPGGPAERAGIKPQDVVVAIDGKNTKGISLFEAGDLLQGEDGSQVQPDPCLRILAGPIRACLQKVTRGVLYCVMLPLGRSAWLLLAGHAKPDSMRACWQG